MEVVEDLNAVWRKSALSFYGDWSRLARLEKTVNKVEVAENPIKSRQ